MNPDRSSLCASQAFRVCLARFLLTTVRAPVDQLRSNSAPLPVEPQQAPKPGSDKVVRTRVVNLRRRAMPRSSTAGGALTIMHFQLPSDGDVRSRASCPPPGGAVPKGGGSSKRKAVEAVIYSQLPVATGLFGASAPSGGRRPTPRSHLASGSAHVGDGGASAASAADASTEEAGGAGEDGWRVARHRLTGFAARKQLKVRAATAVNRFILCDRKNIAKPE